MTQSTNLKNDFRELMLNILWLLFSFKGRITREVYWLGNILLAVGSVLIMRIYLHGSFFIDETMPNQIGDPQFLENIFNQILQNRPKRFGNSTNFCNCDDLEFIGYRSQTRT